MAKINSYGSKMTQPIEQANRERLVYVLSTLFTNQSGTDCDKPEDDDIISVQ